MSVTVTYSESMDASTFCSSWANDGSPQSTSGTATASSVTVTNTGTLDVLSGVTD